MCISLVVEVFGGWGCEATQAREVFSSYKRNQVAHLLRCYRRLGLVLMSEQCWL